MLTQHPIKFVLSKANRSIDLVETTTRQYRTTTPYKGNIPVYDFDFGNNGKVEMELPTISKSVRYHDSNDQDHIEYEIGMKQNKNSS